MNTDSYLFVFVVFAAYIVFAGGLIYFGIGRRRKGHR